MAQKIFSKTKRRLTGYFNEFNQLIDMCYDKIGPDGLSKLIEVFYGLLSYTYKKHISVKFIIIRLN